MVLRRCILLGVSALLWGCLQASTPDADLSSDDGALKVKASKTDALTMSFRTAGCVATGAAAGNNGEIVTVARASPAGYLDALGAVAVCASNTLRVESAGALIEPARPNRFTDPNNLTTWTRRGTATATRDGTASPDGVGFATLLTGIGAKSVNDTYRLPPNTAADESVPLSFWIRKVSTSGVLEVADSATLGKGKYVIDLAKLPSGWVEIGRGPVAGVTYSHRFFANSSGQTGVWFYATSGSGLSFYVAKMRSEVGTLSTSSLTTHSVVTEQALANPDPATWTKRGAATVSWDGTLAPDGVTQARLLSAISTSGLDDVYAFATGLAASADARSVLWFKKVSATGTVRIDSPSGGSLGSYVIDLAALPDGWVQLGESGAPGVTTVAWKTSSSGALGMKFSATGGPVSFYVAEIVQSIHSTSTRVSEAVTVSNPLASADRNWCIDAGSAWTLGSGPNSASLGPAGRALVFTVTDASGSPKPITAPTHALTVGPHRTVACNQAGQLALYFDGRQMGSPAGTGAGMISAMPAALSVTEALGPTPAIRIARSANPATLDQPPSPALVVALTFDDSTSDHYDHVAPLLEAYGMRGTFYTWVNTLGNAGRLTQAQIRELGARGHEIGSHTLSHALLDLTHTTETQLRAEICDSRAQLSLMGLTVRSLAYPGGWNDATARSLADACGYTNARTVATIKGRIAVCGGTGEGGWDFFETLPPPSGWYSIRIPEPSGRTACSPDDFKNLVMEAENNLPAAAGPGVLAFVFHRVCPGGNCDGNPLSFSSEGLADFLDWLQPRSARGTVVRTLSDAVGIDARPVVWSGVP